VRLEKDGYLGWIQTGALHRCSREEAEAYRAACLHLVKADLAAVYRGAVVSGGAGGAGAGGAGEETGKLPFGVPVQVVEWQPGAACLQLPDGRTGWVSDLALLPLSERPRPDPQGIAQALRLFRRFVGVPYLWGGRTPFGFDCSGLAQALWGFLGSRLPRDADQQFRSGLPVEGTPEPGDLLFFASEVEDSPTGSKITHVAVSLGGQEILHANGTTWSVAYNSLDPQSPIYRAWLREHLAGVRRFWG
jgi:cell wall-associated NlpC family hydrolase